MTPALKKTLSERLVKAREAKKGTTRTPQKRKGVVRAKNGGLVELNYGRKQAVFLMCVECLGFEDDPKDCTSTHCPLYPFRGRTMASSGKGGG